MILLNKISFICTHRYARVSSSPFGECMGPSVLLFQATRSFAATSASLLILNQRWSLSLLIILDHVSLGRPLHHLPLGAHVTPILGFWSEDILRTWLSHFHLLALTCSPIVFIPDLSLISSLLTFIASTLSAFNFFLYFFICH